MKTILLVAALTLVGCGKKTEGGGGSGPSCADAVAKAVGAMPGGPGASDVQTKLTAVMTARCTEDKWSAAVTSCYATQVTDMASMKKCREMLPSDQQQKLIGDIRGVMMGAMAAGGGGPMHGAGGGAPMPPAGSAAEPAGSAETK